MLSESIKASARPLASAQAPSRSAYIAAKSTYFSQIAWMLSLRTLLPFITVSTRVVKVFLSTLKVGVIFSSDWAVLILLRAAAVRGLCN